MSFSVKNYSLYAVSLLSLTVAVPLSASQLSVSTKVQANIELLSSTKKCPQCDLSGAVLNRLDLSGANLEGADLSRAKFYLSNLAGANLKNSNLKETEFGGADLAGADLTGADLTGASLAGAYLVGTKMDGEMISTKPYASQEISEVEENVYVEDTVKPKTNPVTEDINIASRRDFEATSQTVVVETVIEEILPETTDTETIEESIAIEVEASIPETSVIAPVAKSAPAMQSVRNIEEPLSQTDPVRIENDIKKSELIEPISIQETIVEESVTEELGQQEIITTPTVAIATVEEGMVDGTILTKEENIELEKVVEDEDVPIQESATEELPQEMAKQEVEAVEPVTDVAAEDVVVIEEVVQKEIVSIQVSDSEEQVLEVAKQEAIAVVAVDAPVTEEIVQEEITIELKETAEDEKVSSKVSDTGEPTQEIANQEGIAVELATEVIVEDVTGIEELAQEKQGMSQAPEEVVVVLSDLVLTNIERLLDSNNCYGCDLSWADLRGEDLDSADLEGANLLNAILSNTDLENANLKGANLNNADLSGADLTGADLYRADLSGADLSNAKLEEALLDDAKMDGVKGYQPALLFLDAE